MRLSSKRWRWLGLGLLFSIAALFIIRTWVVKALIVGQIEAHYRGKVVVKDWWFGLHSSGVTGVVLGETPGEDAPTWFSADRVSTDVSIARLLRGRVMPTRLEVDHPQITFRLDAKGQPITKIPAVPGSKQGGPAAKNDVARLPDIVAKDGVLTFEQEGRKPMTIRGIDARLAPVEDGGKLEVTTNDPTWGKVTIAGHFDPTFKNGSFEITSSPGFIADPEKLSRIPFVPAEVWANLEPSGPVDAKVKIRLAVDSAKPVVVHTEITLKGTAAKLKTLQIESTETTGHVVIDDALVKVEDLKGKSLDGSIEAGGILDFGQKVPRIDLDLRLKDVDVTKAPAAWQLGETSATGRLSGKVDLKVALEPSGPDLTGTIGQAVIENGSFQGIPIKSLSLGLKADGNDLQYAALPVGSVDKKKIDALPAPTAQSRIAAQSESKSSTSSREFEIWEPVLAALPIVKLASHGGGILSWAAYLISEAVEHQVKQGASHGGGLRLPKTISTQIELADVDLRTILEKARKFGVEIPVPISGLFSIKASATIPLGSLNDLKGYVFRGDASLKAASIDHVDLGLVSAHLEFIDGVLDLTDFRGQFVEKPSGSTTNPPKPTAAPPAVGPLPPGAFRGHLHAAISPRGAAIAKFEGVRLPLGELFAPVLPVPTPLSGDLTLLVEAKADLANLADTKTWSLDGHFDSHRIQYQEAMLDEAAGEAHLKEGRLDIRDFSAKLQGRPLKVSGGVELAAPYRYSGQLSIEGWEIAEVLRFVPGMPKTSPASGKIDARGDATGSIQPFDIQTKGGVRVAGTTVHKIPLGNVDFRWKTENDVVSITGLEIFAYGGKVTGEALIPINPGKRLEASATLKGIDSNRLASTFLGKGLSLNGRADGKLKVTMPLDVSVIDAEASLSAPELKVREGTGQPISVSSLNLTAVARKGILDYEATADSLGAMIRFHGSSPIMGDFSKVVADAEIQAAGFRLAEVWKSLGMGGGLAQLDGLGAIHSNVRATLQPFQIFSRGVFELRDLHYGNHLNLGRLSGMTSVTPTTWRVEQVKGELLGGVAGGEAYSEMTIGGPKVVAFDFRLDRASLARLVSAYPSLARQFEGFGTLRVGGRFSDAFQANAEMLVARAKIFGIDVMEVRFPADVELNPVSGIGSVHTRHWSGRVAGGSVRGNLFLRLGADRAFQSETQMTGVDLEVMTRLQSSTKRSVSGKVSGKVVLNGPDPEQIAKMRGRVDLDLDDASLVELPIFKQLDRFLGAAKGGGGLFEDGDLHGTIYNRTLFVEQLTLNGRLIQIHATGSITFDGGLNLEVLVNTNQVIPQSGLALINIIPGLSQALGRGEEAILRVASFLESRLLKFRVSGTIGNPNVQLDPGVAVGDTAVGFFSSVLRVPTGGNR